MIIKSYHVFGSGSCRTYFRPTRKNPIPFSVFYKKAQEQMKDDGHNGFWGTYSCPDSVGEECGWESKEVCWPPARDDYHPSDDGWYTANWWLEAEADSKGFTITLPFEETRHGDSSNWYFGKIMLQGNYTRPHPIRWDEVDQQVDELVNNLGKEIKYRLRAIFEYRKAVGK